MYFKKLLFLMAFGIFILGAVQGQAASVGSPTAGAETAKVKSFKEWKSEKVQDALSRVTSTKTKIQVAKSKDPNLFRRRASVEATVNLNNDELENQLQQDQAVLEMAKDLSVTDYFVGYLTKIQDKKGAFNEVAGKLTSEEVAELMNAYANSVFGSHTPELAPSAQNFSVERVR